MRLLHHLYEAEEEKDKDKKKDKEEKKDAPDGKPEPGSPEAEAEEAQKEMDGMVKMIMKATAKPQINMAMQQVAQLFIRHGDEWKEEFGKRLGELVSPRLHKDFMNIATNFGKTLRHVRGPDGVSQEEKMEQERADKAKEVEKEKEKNDPDFDKEANKHLKKKNAELGKKKKEDEKDLDKSNDKEEK